MVPGGKIERVVKQILAAAVPIIRSNYLEPEDSPFSSAFDDPMRQLISTRLVEPGKTEVDSIAARSLHPETSSLVCFPTYQPQWTLWVVGEVKFGYSVVSTEFDFTSPENEITSQDFIESTDLSGTVDALDSVMVRALKKRVSPIPTEMGAAVCDVWRRVLLLTRYSEDESAGCDGVTYHFGYGRRGSAPMAGKTWSPPEDSLPGMLASISQSLRDHVRTGERSDNQILQRIDEQLSSIRRQL
jgi:hypothetical protein